jgi:hypothetical protein
MQRQTNTTRFIRAGSTPTTGLARWILMGIFAAVIHVGPLTTAAWSSGGLDRVMSHDTAVASQARTPNPLDPVQARAFHPQPEHDTPTPG